MRHLMAAPLAIGLVALFSPSVATAGQPAADRHGHHQQGLVRVVAGLHGGSGSTLGPDDALYVPETQTGSIVRIDPRSGATTTYATGLPMQVPGVGVGGAMDLAFLHHTAYVLVTLVGPDVGGSSTVGLYRMDSPDHFTVVADIGAWAIAHPPVPKFFIPSGVQYAMQRYHGGFLVTDGHHNRLLRVRLDGRISEVVAFDNIVPTGLARSGHTVLMAEAGPVPHLPENGKVLAFRVHSPQPRVVASGARLLVDVEIGHRGTLYALSQGFFTPGHPEGSPADPNTGSLVRADRHGGFETIATGLDRPTSLEIIDNDAYVVTLTGEVWRVPLDVRHHHHH
ncbi:MAG: ScyD/ScyE family protein [Marmoricola sp.]